MHLRGELTREPAHRFDRASKRQSPSRRDERDGVVDSGQRVRVPVRIDVRDGDSRLEQRNKLRLTLGDDLVTVEQTQERSEHQNGQWLESARAPIGEGWRRREWRADQKGRSEEDTS